MPAGCEFTCKNEKCEAFNKGLIINGPWPLGDIDLVLNSSNIKNNQELKNQLLKLKDEGRKLFPIQFPNSDNIPISSYRISLWSNQAKCIWQHDIKASNLEEFEKAIADIENPLPDKCQKTGCKLLNFDEVLKEGIECPFCKQLLQQNRWYSNER